MTSIDSVKNFLEENPLWTGETEFEEGTFDFLRNIAKYITMIVSPVLLVFDFYLYLGRMVKT